MGTHTENDEPNYLQIAQISIPDLTPDPDEYNEETGELGGYGGAGSKPQPEMKFDVMQRIDHPGEVNKARYMPQKPDVICTMAPDGRSLIFDRTKHSSNPTGRVEADLELVGHTAEGFGLGWNPNVEGQIATGSNDKTVKVWWVFSMILPAFCSIAAFSRQTRQTAEESNHQWNHRRNTC